MSVHAGTAARLGTATTVAHAFGLELEMPFELPTLPSAPNPTGEGRRTTVVDAGRRETRAIWDEASDVRSITLKRLPDGRPFMGIEFDPLVGYRVWAPQHGRYVVSGDGTTVHLGLPADATWNWQRLFFAQVLPLAAVLRGLEPLHASAVVLSGRVVGFLASSGTGKSTLATELICRGAAFVTDDVLSVETGRPDGRVLAHPGPALMGIDEPRYAALPEEAKAAVGEPLGESDKLYFLPRPIEGPLPLGALFFLVRAQHVREISVSSASLDPAALLASGFIPYVQDAERLRRHLDACAELAAGVPLLRMEVPPSTPPAEIAAMVEDCLDRALTADR